MGPDHTENKSKQQGAWVTIGSFDGVHIGHQQIIKTLTEGAKAENSASVIVTFFPHPAKVLRPFPDPFYLSTPEEKDATARETWTDQCSYDKFFPPACQSYRF